MDEKTMLLKQIELLDQEHEIIKEKKMIYQTYITKFAKVTEVTDETPVVNPLEQSKSKKNEFNLQSKSQKISSPQITKILKNYFDQTPTISKDLLEQKLLNEYGLQWKNIFDLLGSLRRKGHINVETIRRDNKTFFTIKKK
ncbi:hypothetical protein [Ureibacillus aquaedulcis]|uniref:Uncharacterized protein n=1 Tax=Ureibacillus aquaedulcis TaxID=3058421 RepID=A0ABT8GPM2_9BACL|nr:hypothetical protein [Ureibacillus sp. BA0131]MDN4493368.1 hypothetical protein [Ureibacillus sp. BA0131]